VLDPNERLTLSEIQNHPWILKHCATGTHETAGDQAAIEKVSAVKDETGED
jgi:hypothetical protein